MNRFLFILLMIGLYAASSKVQNRVDLVKNEVQTFSFKKGEAVDSTSSSGIRLHFWHRAIQSIAEKPLIGSGAGSWGARDCQAATARRLVMQTTITVLRHFR